MNIKVICESFVSIRNQLEEYAANGEDIDFITEERELFDKFWSPVTGSATGILCRTGFIRSAFCGQPEIADLPAFISCTE
jgi:hypothetical protein